MDSPTPSDLDEPTGPRFGAPVIPELELQLAMRSLMTSMLGRTRVIELGRYRVRERLGQGGCGLVLLADDPQLEREVAIKVVLPARERELDANWQRALLREAQALAQLRHPNVVEVFDAGTANYSSDSRGAPRMAVYVVMERLRGRTMRQWLAAEPRSWREIVAVHVQAAHGLRATHQVGIVHRDFKPDNVWLTDDGRVVLIDFGLADETDDLEASDPALAATAVSARIERSPGSSGTDSATRRSRVVGTPTYMAPEQHSGHPAGPAADQYAWCVSLFAALHGAPPFVGDSMAELAARKHEARVPARKSGLPRALHQALSRGLAARPSERFATIDALLAAVERATSRPRRGRLWGLVAGAAAVAATASVAGFRAHHPCDADPLDLAAVWTPARRLEVATNLAQIPDLYASALGERVGTRLDSHAQRWRSAYDQVCASDTPRATVAARLECLDRTASQLDQVAKALSTLTIEDIGKATALLDGLRTPDACTSADDRPAEHRDELAELWRRADEMGVMVDATGTLADQSWAQQALARADELEDVALASTIAWRLSQVARAAGQLELAEPLIRTAVFRAAAAHDHARALELMPLLVLAVGSDLGDRAGAEQLIEHARSMAAHLDDPRHHLATVDNALAYILIEKNDPEAAVAIYRRSLATFEAVGRPSPEYARVLLALGGWAVEHHEIEVATEYLARATAILDEVALPTDSNYASIAFNRGGIAEERGDLDGAVAGYREAVDRLRPRLHGHPFVGVGLSAVAIAEARRGQFDAALAAVDEARALAVAAHTMVHPDSIRYTLLQAQISWFASDTATATVMLARALAAIPELPERGDEALRRAHHLGGWIQLAAGELERARAHLEALRALPPGGVMQGIDHARSLRRLEASLALGHGKRTDAGAAMARAVAGPVEPEDFDAALEAALDAALQRRITRPGLAQAREPNTDLDDYRPSRQRAVPHAAFVRTFAGLDTIEPTLATGVARSPAR